MYRNLLPRLQTGENPVNIGPARTREWSTLTAATDLGRLDFGGDDARNARTDVQSIPSPWARMLLFRHALQDAQHPARKLVINELLDAFELVWTLDSLNLVLVMRRLDVATTTRLASRTASKRVTDFVTAVVQLAPDGVDTISIAMVGNVPVFASSPFTVLFTAEDAARAIGNRPYFRYAETGVHRPLLERPREFQEYVATTLIPQLQTPAVSQEAVALLREWLTGELAATPFATTPSNLNWLSAATEAGHQPLGQVYGGVQLFRQNTDVISESRWSLRSLRSGRKPLVVSPGHFDGYYFHGSTKVALPETLPLDRSVLPGLGRQCEWVDPRTDWLADAILLLSEPIDTHHVKGLGANYRWQGPGDDPLFGMPHMLLPLKSAFFKYFTPDDVDRLLDIEVQSNASVSVSLRVPVGVGTEEITIKRTYAPEEVLKAPMLGPALAVWPSFVWDNGKKGAGYDQWSHYAVFRRDSYDTAARNIDISGFTANGEALQARAESRTEVAASMAFKRPPEVLEFHNRSAPGGVTKSLGVILPRFGVPAPVTLAHWHVGVDFGTSNTVVCIRTDGAGNRIFGYRELLLPLTQPTSTQREVLAAYFFPPTLEARPFGTAVVHLKHLRERTIHEDPLGVRVNIPYTGDVQGSEKNRVAGDLKWSTDDLARFLSTAFIRHLLSTIVAQAVYDGVDPVNLTFCYSHPRAFTPSDRQNIDAIWRDALQALPARLAPQIRPAVMDESSAALRHFFNTAHVATGGATNVIVDIGGGTTDIAVYGSGAVMLLDSVLFGGRELTGKRLVDGQGGGNRFVVKFVNWAGDHGLPAHDREVVRAYMDAGQVHLAFGYIATTEWFRTGQVTAFKDQESEHFQSLVFYFFGALFYYLGLSLRAPAEPMADRLMRLPLVTVLAGNGSRYVDWLTGMERTKGPPEPFRSAFLRLLGAGAEVDATSLIPSMRIVLSDAPKEEVARGLVEPVAAAQLRTDTTFLTPAIGESLSLAVGAAGEERSLAPHDRLDNDESIMRVHTLKWRGSPLEIERFHQALLRECKAVASEGGHYTHLAQRLEAAFARFDRLSIEQYTRNKIEYLVQRHGEFRGSIFTLEASVLVERLMEHFYS